MANWLLPEKSLFLMMWVLLSIVSP